MIACDIADSIFKRIQGGELKIVQAVQQGEPTLSGLNVSDNVMNRLKDSLLLGRFQAIFLCFSLPKWAVLNYDG